MSKRCLPLFVTVSLALLAAASAESWLNEQFTTDGTVRMDYDGSGKQVTSLILDRNSGGGFNSKEKYLYGEFSIQMKHIPGNSAGTVTSFYVSKVSRLVSLGSFAIHSTVKEIQTRSISSCIGSILQLSSGEGPGHDEIDMEFMGNSSGAPVVLNTNVWANGDGKKEHQFYLWFDPAADFHTYTIIWNPDNIIFKVDDDVIRCFKHYADLAYPNAKPMTVHATLWDGSYWATQKGKVPIDWSNAPFVVNYRGYTAAACMPNNGEGRSLSCPAGTHPWMKRQLNGTERGTVAWAKTNFMHCNYCEDGWRFPKGFPAECSRN
jgi:xyloglucan:xyloglucosyl transferase